MSATKRPKSAAPASRGTRRVGAREIMFKKQPIERALATLLEAQAAGATHVVLRVRWEVR